jgi:D-alanine-D-alanine ligase
MPHFSNSILGEMLIFPELPVPITKLFIWVFVPYRITKKGLISQLEADPSIYHKELKDVFAEIGIQWKWQPITFENMYVVIEEVAATSSEYVPVVLNYCIGDEDPNYPGTRVYKLLEEKGIPSTGADAASMDFSTSKINMKRAFVEAGVMTSPYEVISDYSFIPGICKRLGTPLIVKPAISTSSRGLSVQSIVHSDEQVFDQIQRLLQGQHEMLFSLKNIFVERFINGPEFTVLLIGSAHQPENIKIYPPIERVFHSSLPETERFLSHDRYLGKNNKDEMPLSPSEPFVHGQQVAADLHDKLCELAKCAYCAVGSNGFGRIDVRMDKASQKIFVLEVNPNCDITADQRSSAGKILHLSGTSFAQLISEIITEALIRGSTKRFIGSR